jgi:hypothetical protein
LSLFISRWTVSLCLISTPSIQYPKPAPTPTKIAFPFQANH